MSSANNSLDSDDGKSIANHEGLVSTDPQSEFPQHSSLPSTTSVLDKSRSLFGNSGNSSFPARNPTPDAHETSPVSEPLVAMAATDEKVESVIDSTLTEDLERVGEEEIDKLSAEDKEMPIDISDVSASKPIKDPEEEELIEKKIVSMDTIKDDEAVLEPTEAMETEENGDESQEIEDEEEEETPKKKAKRAAPTSEDEEVTEDFEDPEGEAMEETGSPGPQSMTEEDEKEVIPIVEEEPSKSVLAPLKVGNEEPASAEEMVEAEEKEEKEKEGDKKEGEEDADYEKAERKEDEKEEGETKEEDVERIQGEPESSTPRGRGRRSSGGVISSSRRGTRGRPSQGNSKVDETEESAPKRRSTRGNKKEEASKEDEEEVPEEQEEDGTEEPRNKRRRSSTTAQKDEAPVEETPEEDAVDEAAEEEVETPKRGRGRRSAASRAAPTPRSARGRGRKSAAKQEVEEEENEEQEEQEEEPARKTRTPRGRKPAVEVETEEKEDDEGEEEEEEDTDDLDKTDAPSSSRRSTRGRASAKSTPKAPPASKKTPARGRKKQASLTEEIIEEEEDETAEVTPPKKGRGGVRSAPSSSTKKKDEFDPYDMDTEMEHHPEPLSNIHMEVQNFGAVKYGRFGASQAKYSMTEKTAESRVPELQTTTPAKNRRSLADMTPGKEKVKHRVSMGTGGRKPRAKKEELEEMEVDVEEHEQPSSSATPSRGRKRKSDLSDVAVPSAKKPATIPVKELTDIEQLRVDNPHDDSDPYAPGSRVYANFQKIFYPAVIVSERDGLSRYKLQFTADKVVKDVPNAGIVPIRAVTPGKIAMYNEESVIIDFPPNSNDANEWAKGNLLITVLDDDGEPTEERKSVAWTELSFEHSEWRDYIKTKEQSATAIVTSNITSIAEASRPRKPPVARPPPKPRATRKPKKASAPVETVVENDMTSSRGASTPRSAIGDDDEDRILLMKEDAVGKNIFHGKAFMITSANRSNPVVTPSRFKKNNLVKFITSNGGIVAEKLTDRYPNHQLILISDTYYRTHKYLAALARGIPCVHFSWLQECGEQGECVDFDSFRLSAGASIFDEKEKQAPKDPSGLLTGRTIFIHSTHPAREVTQNGLGSTFVGIWGPICRLLGANVIDADWETLHETKVQFDIVLADASFKQSVMDYADSIGAAKVTSEWVIQTIILSEAPEPTGHIKFDPFRLSNRTEYQTPPQEVQDPQEAKEAQEAHETTNQ